jgi:hypothetical protein
LALALLLAVARAGAQVETEPLAGVPSTGMDAAEYDRLRRAAIAQAAPEFLSPEAMANLSQQAIEAIRKEFAERGRIQVQSEQFLDYDEKRNIIYSNARTRIRFERYMLEADRVLVHVGLQEIQANGNVVLTGWADPGLTQKTTEVHADSMIFNYHLFQGAAHNVRGQQDIMYFKAQTREGVPGFQMIGRDEARFRDVDFTTSDFPIPEYSIRAREAILVFNDRIFVQRATVYVRRIPVLYLPAYTRSLREPFPWHITFGTSSRLGAYVNVHYNYWHYRYEPSFKNPSQLELRDHGHAVAKVDYFSKHGAGIGLDYDYGFDFDRHKGHTSLYWMPSDKYRNVPEDEGNSRWQVYADHRSQLTDNLYFQGNVDYLSDPELAYDLFDNYSTYDRRRVPERRARGALTWAKDDYVARILLENRQRITRDRITNTLEPTDDDFDYDFDPQADLTDRDGFHRGEGVPSSRYGTVSRRLPHGQFSTSHLPIAGRSPLYYSFDLNAFNNLDKGLNFNSPDDDSYVQGIDLYQQLSYLFRFSQRYTLLAQVGAGVGVMTRSDDSFHWTPENFLNPIQTELPALTATLPDGSQQVLNAVSDLTPRTDILFVDDRTFQTAGGRVASLSDYSPGFGYADLKLRFQGRFTNTLTGNVNYIIREGSKNSLSEFYESIGNRTARADLYSYRTRKHWLTADLTHLLMRPTIMTILAVGRNLQSQSDIYANEPIQFAAIASEYRNQARTLRLRAYTRYDQYQVRDPTDPLEYQRDSVLLGVGGTVAPVNRRWWVETDAFIFEALNKDPAATGNITDQQRDLYRDQFGSDYFFLNENQTQIVVDSWIGRKFGDKWTAELGSEYRSQYNGLRNARFLLTRDLHSAVLQLQARYRNRPWRTTPTETDFRFNISFKLPGPMDAMVAPRARTLMAERRQLELAEDTSGL